MQSQYGKHGCPQMCYSVRVRPTLICMRLKSDLAQHSLGSCPTGIKWLTCTTTSFSRRWISMYSRKAAERHSPAAKIFQSGAPAACTKRCQQHPLSSACACSVEWHINLECAPLLTAVSAVADHVIPLDGADPCIPKVQESAARPQAASNCQSGPLP